MPLAMFSAYLLGEDGDGTRCLAGRLSDDSDVVMKGACHGVELELRDIVAGRAKETCSLYDTFFHFFFSNNRHDLLGAP